MDHLKETQGLPEYKSPQNSCHQANVFTIRAWCEPSNSVSITRVSLVTMRGLLSFLRLALTIFLLSAECVISHTEPVRPTTRPSGYPSQECKVFPGDAKWPSESQWARLNASVDGVLLKPKPAASVCYPGPDYDQAQCQFLVSGASSTRFWLSDPLVELAQWTQGSSCVATPTPVGNCTRGGFPEYVVNATAAKHVQAAVDFARSNNIRLVIKYVRDVDVDILLRECVKLLMT